MMRQVGDEAVIMNLKTNLCMGLDAVGARMWTLLTASDSIQAAYESILGEYDVDPQTLRTHMEEFLGELEQNGLIEVYPLGAP